MGFKTRGGSRSAWVTRPRMKSGKRWCACVRITVEFRLGFARGSLVRLWGPMWQRSMCVLTGHKTLGERSSLSWDDEIRPFPHSTDSRRIPRRGGAPCLCRRERFAVSFVYFRCIFSAFQCVFKGPTLPYSAAICRFLSLAGSRSAAVRFQRERSVSSHEPQTAHSSSEPSLARLSTRVSTFNGISTDSNTPGLADGLDRLRRQVACVQLESLVSYRFVSFRIFSPKRQAARPTDRPRLRILRVVF